MDYTSGLFTAGPRPWGISAITAEKERSAIFTRLTDKHRHASFLYRQPTPYKLDLSTVNPSEPVWPSGEALGW